MDNGHTDPPNNFLQSRDFLEDEGGAADQTHIEHICELIVILIDNFGSLLCFLLPKEGRWSPYIPDSGVEIRKYFVHEGILSYIVSHKN